MVSAPGVYVALQMRDPGVGIEPTVQERIFEPFFTTKGLGSGTGLVGVYGTLTDHRGAATVESVLGKGSVFTRYLPMSRRRAAARPHGGSLRQAQELIDAGPRGFLQKPFSMASLADRLGPLLKQ